MNRFRARWALLALAALLTTCQAVSGPQPGVFTPAVSFVRHVYYGPIVMNGAGAVSAPPPTALTPPTPLPSPTPLPAPSLTPEPPRPTATPVPRKPGWGIDVADWTHTQLLYELGFEWIQTYLPPDYPVPPYKILYRISLGDSVSGRQEDIDQFARVVEGVAWNHRGVIQAYAIGNEVNLAREWKGSPPDPELYARLLKIAYDRIKAADPSALVATAGLAPTGGSGADHLDDLAYARRMLQAGAGQSFDVYAFHPYGFAYPPEQDPDAPGVNGLAFRRAEAHRALLEEFGLGAKPMWATEFGWLIDPQQEGRSCSWPGLDWQKVTLNQQAEYARRAYDYARANWPWMGVMFLWNYDFSQSPLYPDGCEQMKWFSIVDLSGRPRPIVEALRP